MLDIAMVGCCNWLTSCWVGCKLKTWTNWFGEHSHSGWPICCWRLVSLPRSPGRSQFTVKLVGFRSERGWRASQIRCRASHTHTHTHGTHSPLMGRTWKVAISPLVCMRRCEARRHDLSRPFLARKRANPSHSQAWEVCHDVGEGPTRNVPWRSLRNQWAGNHR